ncbi:MAG: UDP-3-O-(3-hydroxymyristoyl)glucosamine N-acyltransferase [Hyphomicrobiaceae bacterium]
MEHKGFFVRSGPFPLREVAADSAIALEAGSNPEQAVHDVRPLDKAGPGDVTFIDNKKYRALLASTRAGACFIAPANRALLPPGVTALVTPEPYRAFARALARFYPEAGRPRLGAPSSGDGPISPSARIEDGVEIGHGAVIGAEAEIGRGTVIAPGAFIGYRVAIGRDCYIGPGVAVVHALIGDRVILHGGVQIGHDGFGFAMGGRGHLKVPQIGRVIVQDNVEIGANSTVDRGALADTVIGEGTKIDNLVQIGHNVVIGRHCVIVGQVGVSGSVELGDFVVIGGQAGIVGHLKIGTGAQIAGGSGVTHDIPAGQKYGGSPAKPLVDWVREIAALKRLARRQTSGS